MAIRVDMLRAFLRQTVDGSISQTDLSKFVQLARILVTSYVSSFRSSAAVLCEHQGISLTDLALDCVADIFARDIGGSLFYLENFVNALNRPLDQTPDHELIAAFRSLLSRFCDMQLGRLYAQSDPGGARIHRNIRECARNHGEFSISRDFRGWVISPAGVPAQDHLPPCSTNWLESEFSAHLDGAQQIPRLMDILREILMAQTEFRRSIPLVEVVRLFRGVYQVEQRSKFEEREIQSLEGMSEFEIDQLRGKVEQVLKAKILVTYVAHGKVDRPQGEAMYLAYCDLLADWCSGDGTDIGIYEYLKRYLPMDERIYKDGFRVKMEYLMKIAREEFANRLMSDL